MRAVGMVTALVGAAVAAVVVAVGIRSVPDIKRYESFLHETAFKLPGVTHVRSSVVLKEVKSESRLPLDEPRPRAEPGKSARR